MYGIDYQETSPVTKLISVRLLISFAATYHWINLYQECLHGILDEEVYIEQHLSFAAQGEFRQVYCLRKSLYWLKLSTRAWFGRFASVI